MRSFTSLLKKYFVPNLYAFLPVTLACISPFINFAAQNTSELLSIYTELGKYFVILLVGTTLIALVACNVFLRRKPVYAICNAIAVFMLQFFMYFDLHRLIKLLFGVDRGLYSLPAWACITLVVTWVVYRISNHRHSTFLLSIFIAAFLIIPLVKVSSFVFNVSNTDSYIPPSNEIIANFKHKKFKPNVYFFILDQHVRHDVLEHVFKSSNKSFISQLEKRGFYIATEALSNYSRTNVSIPSTFAMDYLVRPGHEYDSVSEVPIFGGHPKKNLVVNIFKESGYKFYLAEGPVKVTECGGIEDFCLKGSELDELLVTILMLTPIVALHDGATPHLPFIKKIFPAIRLPVHDPEILATNILTFSKPFFFFAHIFLPHSPYRYNKDCSPITFEMGQADDHTPGEGVDVRFWRSLYANQLHCTDRKILAAIDMILEADSNAIIIVQGDHGTNSQNQDNTPISTWSKSQFTESFGIINALRISNHCQSNLYPPISPVNTFRLIFSCLAGKPIDLLEDKSFLMKMNANTEKWHIEEWQN